LCRSCTNTSQRRSRCAGHIVLYDGDPAIMVNGGQVELVVLSASRSAIADAQAEQKAHHQGAHPECGIGGHKFPLAETGPATTRLRERSASRLRRTRS
jgi:hypothetical protein